PSPPVRERTGRVMIVSVVPEARRCLVPEARRCLVPEVRRCLVPEAEGSIVKYQTIAEAYRDLEQASGRLALVDRLATLLASTPITLLPTVCYLCQGMIAPEFAGIDLGLAEKLAIRAVATASGSDPKHVAAAVRETGDLGQAAERLL